MDRVTDDVSSVSHVQGKDRTRGKRFETPIRGLGFPLLKIWIGIRLNTLYLREILTPVGNPLYKFLNSGYLGIPREKKIFFKGDEKKQK